jgi:polysaccharide export outer membrane protein
VQQEIKEKYAKMFNTAEITLNRIERQPFRASVIGLAKNSGQHVISRKGVTIAELIALSGGTIEEPFLCDYLIHRNKKTYTLTNDQIMKEKILAQDEDLIEIKRSGEHFITMMGSVNRPGNYKFPKNHCHLSDFLGESSGMNINQADATGVFIFRSVGKRTHLYRFNLEDPEGLILASKFYIHGKDIIYVTEAPLSKWDRVIKGILPFGQLQSFGNVANVGN